MYRLVLLLILLFPILAIGQDTIQSNTIEKDSYDSFKKGDWEETIKIGKLGLKNKSDYFYLRHRMGIAYYNLKKYRLAEKEFRMALKFDSYSELNNEYLYYSYLKNDSYDLARKQTKKFTNDLRATTLTKSMAYAPLAYLEVGKKISGNTTLFSDANYFQIGFNHRLGRSLSVSHAYSSYTQTTSFGEINQNQYYLGLQVPIAKTWLITPSAHLLSYKLETEYSYVPSQPPFASTPKAITEISKYNETNLVVSIAAKKVTSVVDIIPALSYSNLNKRDQLQGSLTVNLYPFGSNKFSLGSTAIVQKDSAVSGFGYRFLMNYQPIRTFKLTATYYNGNMLNYNEDNGFVVNNSFYYTNYKIAIIPELQLSKRVSIYSVFQHENKSESNFINNFNYTTILFGLKLNTF